MGLKVASQQNMPPVQLREITNYDHREIEAVARLHTEILDFGPMSQLGERFVRNVGYELPLGDELLKVTVCTVDGEIAGFIAYTPYSLSFQRETITRHWPAVLWNLVRAIVEDPRRLWGMVLAAKFILSRGSEGKACGTAVGEFAALAVRPEYTTADFFRRMRLRVGETLTKHAVRRLETAGVSHIRGFVDADNKPALLMYQRLGARFERCRVGGRPMVRASFNVDQHASGNRGVRPE